MGDFWKHVAGNDKDKVVLYTLSTCGWCRKTKTLLSEMGVGYSYVDVDLLQGPAREQVIEAVTQWNPRASFPTIVINNRESILGFDEEKIREALGS